MNKFNSLMDYYQSIKNIMIQTILPCITVDRKWSVEQKHICCLQAEVDHKIDHKGNRPKTNMIK